MFICLGIQSTFFLWWSIIMPIGFRWPGTYGLELGLTALFVTIVYLILLCLYRKEGWYSVFALAPPRERSGSEC